MSLTDLTATTIEAAYVRMAKDGTSKDAIHKCHMKLRQMMRKAYNAGLVRRNPCDAVEVHHEAEAGPGEEEGTAHHQG